MKRESGSLLGRLGGLGLGALGFGVGNIKAWLVGAEVCRYAGFEGRKRVVGCIGDCY